MRHVAFVRNGSAVTCRRRTCSPRSRHGCAVRRVRSNGTVVFEGDPGAALDAVEALAARTGVVREVFVLSLAQVVAVVDEHGAAPTPGGASSPCTPR